MKHITLLLIAILATLCGGCAAITSAHQDAEIKVQGNARRTIEETHTLDAKLSFEGSAPTTDGALRVALTETVTCRDEVFDRFEEQRQITRRFENPYTPLAFGLIGVVSSTCSGLHAAQVGCVSPAEEEGMTTPPAPYTREEHTAMAASFGAIGLASLSVMVVDLVRARDTVEVLGSRDEVRRVEERVCGITPAAGQKISLVLFDTQQAPLTATTDAQGVATFPLHTLLASEEVAADGKLGRLELPLSQHREVPELPSSWRAARASHFQQARWAHAEQTRRIKDYLTYLEHHPQGLHAAAAHQRLRERLGSQGSADEVLTYLAIGQVSGELERALHLRYLSTRGQEILSKYDEIWQHADALDTLRVEAEPEWARAWLGQQLLARQERALSSVDAADFDERWRRADALWRLHPLISGEDVTRLEAPTLKLVRDELEAIASKRTRRSIEEALSRLETRYDQASLPLSRQVLAQLAGSHHLAIAQASLEAQELSEAKRALTRASKYFIDSNTLQARYDEVSRAVQDAEAAHMASSIDARLAYEDQVVQWRVALEQAGSEPVREALRVRMVKQLEAQLLSRLASGEPVQEVFELLDEDGEAMTLMTRVLVTAGLARAEAYAERGLVEQRAAWRVELDTAHLLAESTGQQEEVARVRRRIEAKLHRAYPISELEQWGRRYRVIDLYPITREDAEEALSAPASAKGDRVLVWGTVEKEVGAGKYLVRTDGGSLALARGMSSNATSHLSGGGRLMMLLEVEGTMTYRREKKKQRIAKVDVLAAGR